MQKVPFEQYFLTDINTAERIISALEVSHKDIILEIGPGKGSLTERLIKKAKKVIAVEVDKKFKKDLRRFFNLAEIIFGDGLKFLDRMIKTKIKIKKIISSLPSSLVEPVVNRLIKLDFDMACFLVPLKFVAKFYENPVYKSFFQVTLLQKVDKRSFTPQPKTNWAMIKIVKKRSLDTDNMPDFLIRYLYTHPRTKLKNALMEAIIQVNKQRGKVITKNEARKLFMQLDFRGLDMEKTTDLSDKSLFEELKKFEKIFCPENPLLSSCDNKA